MPSLAISKTVKSEDICLLIIGVRVILPFAAKSTKEITDYIEENYIEGVDAYGHFRLFSQKGQNKPNLNHLMELSDICDEDLDNAWGTDNLSKTTYVDMLVGDASMDRTPDLELATYEDQLNKFVEKESALGWSQFSISI